MICDRDIFMIRRFVDKSKLKENAYDKWNKFIDLIVTEYYEKLTYI